MSGGQQGMTKEEDEEKLRRSVVRIFDRGRSAIGTGFFVTSNLVVTCAHVVREALQEKDEASHIAGGEVVELQPFADMPDGQEFVVTTVEARYFRDEDAEDVAFLRLSSALPDGIQPLALATSQGLVGHTIRGWAFPESDRAGLWMIAEVAGPLDGPRTGLRRQLSSTNISPGCSGGPLWDEQHRVVGMAVSIVVRDETGRHHDTAKAIAAEVLAKVCQELSIEHVERRPSVDEQESLRQQISLRFADALQRGELSTDASTEIGADLQRLLGTRGEWIEAPGCHLASVAVKDNARDDLRLPLELLRPPTGAEPVLLRCALAETETVTETVTEGPRNYPEGGRIVLATADAGGPVPDEALLKSMREVCCTGLHLAGSEHDRKRGAFDPELDHLPRVSRATLRQALGPRDDRPGAAVLQLVCHVYEGGLCLHDDDSGAEVLVGAEALAAVLVPFAPHLRLVVLVPVAEQPQSDPGRTSIDVAMALHRRGLAAVVAPRVPLPGAALPGTTTVLFGALLGDARVAPCSLEVALVRANGHLSTKDGLAHLGLRLFARASDGDDTRPLVIRPYRGLLSFEPEHARFYAGREDETTQVVRRLAELHAKGEPRFLLLVGASGVGKSSLAKAGVVPALAKEGWTAFLTRPAQHSGDELEALVEEQAAEPRLVVVDQFEEVLTETDSHQEAARYLQRLWALASEEGTAVLATMQVSALDRGAEMRVEAEADRDHAQRIPG